MLERIAIVTGPFDPLRYEVVNGYLVEGSFAIYLGDDGTLWLTRVERYHHKDRLFVDTGHAQIIGTDVDRGEIVIEEIYEVLRKMTGWEFLTRVVLNSDDPTEFHLDKMPAVLHPPV